LSYRDKQVVALWLCQSGGQGHNIKGFAAVRGRQVSFPVAKSYEKINALNTFLSLPRFFTPCDVPAYRERFISDVYDAVRT
jgi:hypothetical protein